MDVEGIVLKVLPYGERDRIITLFSEQGLIRCFVKNPKTLQPTLLALTTPFTQAQYLLTARKTMLYQFVDGSVIEQHLGLRQSLEQLHTAVAMARALIHTQWPDKPTPSLYALFVKFLKKINENNCPLLVPFLIKLLKHEGVLHTEQQEGWSLQEHQLLIHLAHMRSLEYIPHLSEDFIRKTEDLFDGLLRPHYSKTTTPSAMLMSKVNTTSAVSAKSLV